MWNRQSLGLLAGSSLAGFGMWIDFLAILTLAAYEYKADAYVMALISAMFLGPAMLLGSRMGRWVDRNEPRNLLLGWLTVRAGVTGLLMVAPSLWMFCALVALRSLAAIPTDPAANALVGRLVSKEDAPRFFGVLGILRNASKIAAPAIGTAIASQFGEGKAIALSMILVAAAVAVMLLTVPAAASPAAAIGAAPTSAVMQGASDADPAIIDRGLLSRFVWTVTIYVFMVFLINNQLPVLLRNAGFDKALLGVLVSCSGAGGVLAGTYLSRKDAARVFGADPLRATLVSVIVSAVCFVGLGLGFALPSGIAPYVAGALFFCTGIFASIEAIRANTVVVQEFPGAVGEVTGKVQSFQSTAMLAAPWVAAALVPFVSMSQLFVLDGALALVLLALVTLLCRRKNVKTPSAATAATGTPST